MTGTKYRASLAAFALLSAGVGGNLLMMQPSTSGAAGQRGLIDRSAARAIAERPRPPVTNPALAQGAPAHVAGTEPAPPVAAVPQAKAKSDMARTVRSATTAQPAATEAPPTGTTELAAAVQRELLARGYEPGTPDGTPGLVTRAAIMAFEHDHNLALTGEPSEALLRALQAGPAAINASAYATAAKDKRARAELVVRTIQQSLAGLGYTPGKTSGRVNDETERAIREFEMDQGLRVTGRISGPLVARLARAAGNGKLASGR